ncbi:MAG TPA: M67 family metallopeptidase [Actinomycetota bacterium]|nr:M67 family metallopeptidase [Actinomycetota bacterium]
MRETTAHGPFEEARSDVLTLPRELYNRMVSHARTEFPNEACGVVAGRDGRALRVYPMRNAEASPVVYRFDEREQLRVFNEIDRKGWDMLAFFHSHTHTDAYPSPTDRAEAHWSDPETLEEVPAYPQIRYLILSLMDREPVLRAFRFEGGEPVEEEVRID